MTTRTRQQDQKKEDAVASNVNEPIMAMLKATLEEHKTSLSAEFKASVERFEAKLDNIQSTINSHNQRITSLENAVTASSDEVQDLTAKLTAVVDDNAKLKAKLVDLEGRSRRNNVRVIGVPEDIEWPRPTAFFSQLLVDVFGAGTFVTAPELDRAHRTLTAKPASNARPRAVVLCFHNYQVRELVVRKARELRGKLKYKDAPIHIVEDYCPEVLEERSAYRGVMKDLYELGLKPQLRYPAKLFIMTDSGNRKRLSSPSDARNYIASHRPLSSSSLED